MRAGQKVVGVGHIGKSISVNPIRVLLPLVGFYFIPSFTPPFPQNDDRLFTPCWDVGDETTSTSREKEEDELWQRPQIVV